MTRSFKFSIATSLIPSDCVEVKELQFDDDATEEEIEEQVNEIYSEWVSAKNYGTWTAIEENTNQGVKA